MSGIGGHDGAGQGGAGQGGTGQGGTGPGTGTPPAGGWGAYAGPPTSAPAPGGPPAPVWQLVLAPVVALLLAAAAAFAAGALAFYGTGGRGNASDKVDNLGPALLAFGVGTLVGVGAAIVLLVAAARRVLPPERRGGAIAGALLAVPVAGVLLGVLGASVREGTRWVTVGGDLVSVALLLAPSTAFVVAGRGARWRARADGSRDPGSMVALGALVLVGALVASVVVVVVAGSGTRH